MAITRIGGANAISGSITSSNLPSGSILQVQSTLISTADSQSISANTDTAINNLEVNITPSSTSSKIMLLGRFVGEGSDTSSYNNVFFFMRGSTVINSAAASGSRNNGMTVQYIGYGAGLDAASTMDGMSMFTIDAAHNSTSELTYKIGINISTAATLYINRTVSNTDNTSHELATSEIIAMEIKG